MARTICQECNVMTAEPGDVLCYGCKNRPFPLVLVPELTEQPKQGPVYRIENDDDTDPPAEPLIVPAPTNPYAVAKRFVQERYDAGDGLELVRHHRNTYYTYDGSSWPETEDRALAAELYRWLEDAWYWKKTAKSEELTQFEPSRRKMGDLDEALAALVHLDARLMPPTWLDEPQAPAEEIVPMANGLLHMPTRQLLPHTPAFFAPHVLPFDYDPDAPYPSRWHRFLEELWPTDEESRQALAEVMGYLLGGGTRLQKIMMLVGPKRSGKGTIGRVLTGLLGAHNVAAPTLSSLTTNFGMSPLIDRPLALISDARLGARADGSIAVERLLSISGEDSITIDRKYRDPWTGRLPTRFLILTNEIPRFTDASGALASRFVMLVLTETFLGREDPALTDELLEEAPGIFNWALEGLDRLVARGYFEQPPSAREALVRLEDMSSPVGAFVRDRCIVGPAHEIEKDAIFADWKDWCLNEGRERAGTKAVFSRDLTAAFPGITPRRTGTRDKRIHVYQGIALRPQGWEEQWETPLTTPDTDGGGP